MRWDEQLVDERIERITRFPFRAKFHLRGQELDYLARKGLPTVREHAHDFIRDRVGPAHPAKDGQQTPWGGHPVFRAQHATGTCCRGCLEKNHRIPKGRAMTDDEIAYAVAVIMRWIERDLRRAGIAVPLREDTPAPPPPTLF